MVFHGELHIVIGEQNQRQFKQQIAREWIQLMFWIKVTFTMTQVHELATSIGLWRRRISRRYMGFSDLHRLVFQNQRRFSKTESTSFNRRKIVSSPTHIALTQRIILFLTQNTDVQGHNSSGVAILARPNTQVPPTISGRECKSLRDKAMSPLLYTLHSLKPTFLSLIRTYFFHQKLTFLSAADGTWIFP